MAELRVTGLVTDATLGTPAPGYGIRVSTSVRARYNVLHEHELAFSFAPDGNGDGIPAVISEEVISEAAGPTITTTTNGDGRFNVTLDMTSAEEEATGVKEEFAEDDEWTGGVQRYSVTVTVHRNSGATVAGQLKFAWPDAANFPNVSFESLQVPRRRIIILDLDGLRWDVLYRHLKRVRDAGASLTSTYAFTPQSGALRNTVIGEGADLRSALGFLCFGDQMGRVDVRFARAPFPSFTFPSHATMFTGVWPNRHGIAGHAYMLREPPFQWLSREWEVLPLVPALQGFCTSEEGGFGAFWDWWWDGFDEADGDNCPDRNQGLVSDLMMPTMYESALLPPLNIRSAVIHNFFHGASQPWTDAGKDAWWHMTNAELRQLKDVCSDDDPDQFEPMDSSALIKAQLLLAFEPNSVALPTVPYADFDYSSLVDPLTGDPGPLYANLAKQAHEHGPPELITIYLASIDHASHLDGTANQATYLAWFDHRLAEFVEQLMGMGSFEFNNTVFALVADHGHSMLLEPQPGRAGSEPPASRVWRELVRAAYGDEATEASLLGLASSIASLRGRFAVFTQAMNLFVYILNTVQDNPLEITRALLQATMRVEPVGAFVRDDGRYKFWARGADGPVEVDSPEARLVLGQHLDVPPAGPLDETEIRETSLSPEAEEAERRLREQLRGPDGFDLLRVAERIRGFGPREGVPATRSPDVVLIAPARQSFSEGNKATHGSLAYPVTRIPMMFFGRGVDATATIDEADMVDFAPTILSLLGDASDRDVDGHRLLDYWGAPKEQAPLPIPIRPPREQPPQPRRPPFTPPIGPRYPVGVPPLIRPPVTASLQEGSIRQIPPSELSSLEELPWAVALTLRLSGASAPRLTDLGVFHHVFTGTNLHWSSEDEEIKRLVNGVELPPRDSDWIGWEGRNSLRSGEQSHVLIEAVRGGDRQALRVPRELAIQYVGLDMTALPPWIRLLIRSSTRLVPPYTLKLGKPTPTAGDRSTSHFDAEPVASGTARSSSLATPREVMMLLLEADSFYFIVDAAAARIDGARMLTAQSRLTDAMLLAAPGTAELRHHWEQSQDGLLHAWELVKAAVKAGPVAPQPYDAALMALRATAASLPGPLAELAAEAAASLRARLGRMPSCASDAERVRVGLKMTRRLMHRAEVTYLRFPGTHHLS